MSTVVLKDMDGNILDPAYERKYTSEGIEEIVVTAAPIPNCPVTLLPQVGDLMDTLGKLANLPGELERVAITTFNDELQSKVQSVQAVVDGIEDALGNFPLSYVPDGTVKCPEWEKQDLAQCIHNEYKMICQIKIAEIVTKVIPISLSIPTPLGFSVDVVELFKNPEYKSELLAKLRENFEEFRKMIPQSMQEMWTEMGIVHDEMGLRKMFQWLIQELSGGLYGLLMGAFKKAIKMIEDLGLSILGLPELLTFDIEGALQAMIKEAKEMGENWMEELEKKLQAFSLFGFTIEDIVGSVEENIQSAVRRVDRMMENLRKFTNDWAILQLEFWIEKVMSLLEKIGIKIPFVPFTFCDFLKLIGLMPLSIALPDGLGEFMILTEGAGDGMKYDKPYGDQNPDGTEYDPDWTPPE